MRKKTSFHSLRHPKDLFWICLGSSLGIGNFFYIPELIIGTHSIVPLLIYGIVLFLLVFPVMSFEFFWGRWFQSSLVQSFKSFGRWASYATSLALLSVIFTFPLYLKKVVSLTWLLKSILQNGGQVPSGSLRLLEPESWILALLMFVLWNLCLLILSFPKTTLTRICKMGLIFVGLVWLGVGAASFNFVNWSSFVPFFSWDTSRVGFSEIFTTALISLASVGAGLGIFQTLVASSSVVSHAGAETDQNYWKKPGQIFYLVFRILCFDFLVTIFALFLMSPFSETLMSPATSQFSLELVFFEWLPQIWGPFSQAFFLNSLWFLSLVIAGLLSVLIFIEFLVFELERLLNWNRRKVLFLYSLGSLGLFLASVVPSMYQEMWYAALYLFWPAFALFFCIWVGFQMPLKTQQRILGRSLWLDQISLALHWLIKWVIPSLLGLLVVFGILMQVQALRY